jgi:hypothetical protein
MRLPLEERVGAVDIAAAAWLSVAEPPKEAHRRSMSHAASLAVGKLTGYALWLLSGHTAWQPDSRITRHRKLWASLKARGLVVPFGRDFGENVVEEDEGIRFFGALQLGLGSLDSVVAILEAEPVSHLVALKLEDDGIAAALTHRGWHRSSFGPSADVLGPVCGAEGIVFWPVGAFDDREAGCVALAKAHVIDQLVR